MHFFVWNEIKWELWLTQCDSKIYVKFAKSDTGDSNKQILYRNVSAEMQ